jgi:hypothetical protein
MDLTANGQVLTGTWSKETNPVGYYQGAVYRGAIQLLLGIRPAKFPAPR